MNGIVAIASFPKSGNTWLRAFMTAILNGTPTIDINAIRVPNFADVALLEHFLGISVAHLTIEELTVIRGHLSLFISRTHKGQFLIKTHDAWFHPDGGTPLIPRSAVQKVIYIVRDPRDIAVSLSHHLGLPISETIDSMNSAKFILAPVAQERMSQLPQIVGSWSHHVNSWLSAGHPSVLLVRYEDLSSDTERVCRNILDFLGTSVSPQALRTAIAASSFEELRRHEIQHGFRECSPFTDRFFRAGKVNAWPLALTPAEAHRILTDHGSTMTRLQYH